MEDEKIKEGKAEILISDKKVFYNPVQEFNRDISVAVLRLFAKTKTDEGGISILEALSATGLRSIRYAKEVENVRQIVANDISLKAAESIERNIKHNHVENLVTSSHEDATMVMYQARHKNKRFDVVDLDPYGCPSQFLDGAVQSLSNGGLLLVTATDMAVLAGNSPETCYVKYGAVSLKSRACHELALRILLQHIASHAGRYGRYIEPVLSLSVDFYIRVFVRVYSSQVQCKNNTSKIGLVHQCVGCESITIQPLGVKINTSFKLPNGPAVDQLCKYCRHKHHTGGPIWIGSLHDQSFVQNLLDNVDEMELGTVKRIKGVLSVIHEELDVPLYYVLDRVMSIIKCHTPSIIKFRSALLNAGYNVSFSHTHKVSIKTDAPTSVIWDIARAWEKLYPVKRDRLDENSAALAILNAENTQTNVSFDLHPLANPASRKNRLARFQLNPMPNWGPGTRATLTMLTDDDRESISKKRKNQSKTRHQPEKQAKTNLNNEITKP